MVAAALPNPKTRMTPQWIEQAVRQNPWTRLENGNWRTPPVRLSYPHLFKPVQQQQTLKPGETPNMKHEVTLLFCGPVDHSPWMREWTEKCNTEFPGHVTPQGQVVGLHAPWRDQAEKCMKYEGYMPGNVFMKCTSNFKPQVVMPGALAADGTRAFNPVVDESLVYSGVWAIVTLNFYTFGKSPPQPKKGVKFGIQNVVIIAPDEKFGGGGGTDPNQDFAGVTIDASTDFAAMMAGAPIAGAIAPPANPMSIMPAATPVMAAQPMPGLLPIQQLGNPAYPQPAAAPYDPRNDPDLAGLV